MKKMIYLNKNEYNDMIGKKFNRLTVISLNEETSIIYNRKYFNCVCECGKETTVRGDSLLNNEIKSCGCTRIKNLLNKKFGTLTVIKFVGKLEGIKNGIYWECECKCGDKIIIRGTHLLSGNTKSCGRCCFIKDITGKIYGKLKVIKIDKNDTKVRWICACECGNIISVRADNLQNGHVKSCGCSSKELSKQTCMEKYGVCYPSQDKNIALKQAKSQNNSCIIKHWKTGEELACVASYEKLVVEYLNANKINFRWQSKIFKMPDGRTYRPDLYLFSTKQWIEVKGYFRKDAKEKWDWFHKEHPNSELWDKTKLKEMKIL